MYIDRIQQFGYKNIGSMNCMINACRDDITIMEKTVQKAVKRNLNLGMNWISTASLSSIPFKIAFVLFLATLYPVQKKYIIMTQSKTRLDTLARIPIGTVYGTNHSMAVTTLRIIMRAVTYMDFLWFVVALKYDLVVIGISAMLQ